jgi:hypothetical protein
MSWWKKDQEAQERGEVQPMPRELTDEELEAQQRREGLFPENQGDDTWLFWWER